MTNACSFCTLKQILLVITKDRKQRLPRMDVSMEHWWSSHLKTFMPSRRFSLKKTCLNSLSSMYEIISSFIMCMLGVLLTTSNWKPVKMVANYNSLDIFRPVQPSHWKKETKGWTVYIIFKEGITFHILFHSYLNWNFIFSSKN